MATKSCEYAYASLSTTTDMSSYPLVCEAEKKTEVVNIHVITKCAFVLLFLNLIVLLIIANNFLFPKQNASPSVPSIINSSSLINTSSTVTPSLLPPQTQFEGLNSYNLCPAADVLTPPSLYPQEDDHDMNQLPYLRFNQTKENRHIEGDALRLYIHETRYDYNEGVFVLVCTVWSDSFNDRAPGGSHNSQLPRVRPQVSNLHKSLSCWDSITRVVTPVYRDYLSTTHFEFRCPFARFPAPIPSDIANFTLLLLQSYSGPMLTPVNITNVANASLSVSGDISICRYRRPIFDWIWCSNGLQGKGMDVRLKQFIKYQHYIGIDRFMFFDDDGLYLETLRPLIDSGIVEYRRSSRMYRNQVQGYIQDVLSETCRQRFWYAARWMAFWDIDEFPVFVQPDEKGFNISSERDSESIEPILYNPNYVKSDKSSAVVPWSSSLLNTATVAMQNLLSNRHSYLVGTAIHECLMLEDSDPSSALLTRFQTCNRFNIETKYWFRPAQGRCATFSHAPQCPSLQTSDFQRRDRIVLAHYFNARSVREKMDDTFVRLPMPTIDLILRDMQNNSLTEPMRG